MFTGEPLQPTQQVLLQILEIDYMVMREEVLLLYAAKDCFL
jgi:hypothetical protein